MKQIKKQNKQNTLTSHTSLHHIKLYSLKKYVAIITREVSNSLVLNCNNNTYKPVLFFFVPKKLLFSNTSYKNIKRPQGKSKITT